MMDYEKDISINKFRLDEEVEKHPVTKFAYHKEAHKKEKEVDLQKERINVLKGDQKKIESKLYIKFKSEKIDGKNPTENQVDSMINLSDDFQEIQRRISKAQERLIEIEYEKNILFAAVSAFSHRRSMLEKMCEFEKSGYYSKDNFKDITRGVK